MRISEALQGASLSSAKVITGKSELGRVIQWVHTIDHPDVAQWVRAGQLILTTGVNWPTTAVEQRALVRELDQKSIAGVVLAVPRFLKHFPKATVEEARALNLPLLEVPWSAGFSAISEEIHSAILTARALIIERADEIHRALTRTAIEAHSLTQLVDVLSSLTGCSVLIEGMESNALARSHPGNGSGAFQYETGAREAPSAKLTQALSRRGDLERIRTSMEAVRIEAMPEFGLVQTVACGIRIGMEMVGTVWVAEGEVMLTEVDLRAAEHAALIAALLTAHQRELRLEEKRLGYTFFDSLMEGHIEDLAKAVERAKLIGFDPDSEYRCCIFLLNVPAPLSKSDFQKREQAAELIRLRLKKEGAAEMISVSSNMVMFLAAATVDLPKLLSYLAPIGGGFGVSRTYRHLENIKAAWAEAKTILPYIKPKRIYFAEQMLLQMVIAGDQRAQSELIQQTFGQLKKHTKGDLTWTMQILSKHDFHLAHSADELGVHLGTLRYRMNKIAEILQMDFSQIDSRLKVHLACRLFSDLPAEPS